jgi:urease accessory protein
VVLRLVPAPPAFPEGLAWEGDRTGPSPDPDSRRAGEGELVFEKSGGKTVLSRSYAKAPLKWVKSFHRAPAAWVYASSYGGGLVGGDRLRLRIRTGPGALGFVTTQSSTKVYRSGLGAGQSLEARVEGQGRFVWLPDPLVCFEGSDYEQRQDFHLEEGAGLICYDAVASGRRSRNERWKFRRYLNRTRVFQGGKTVFYDALRLDRRDGPLGERMGRFNLLSTLVVYGDSFQAGLESILKADPLRSRPRLLEYQGRVGKEGVVWRWAGEDPEEVADRVKGKLSFLSRILGDDPWKRKLGF